MVSLLLGATQLCLLIFAQAVSEGRSSVLSQQIPSELRVILSVVASHRVLECYQGVPFAARAPGGLVEEAKEDALE